MDLSKGISSPSVAECDLQGEICWGIGRGRNLQRDLSRCCARYWRPGREHSRQEENLKRQIGENSVQDAESSSSFHNANCRAARWRPAETRHVCSSWMRSFGDVSSVMGLPERPASLEDVKLSAQAWHRASVRTWPLSFSHDVPSQQKTQSSERERALLIGASASAWPVSGDNPRPQRRWSSRTVPRGRTAGGRVPSVAERRRGYSRELPSWIWPVEVGERIRPGAAAQECRLRTTDLTTGC